MINKSFAQDWLVLSLVGAALLLGTSLGQVATAAMITLHVETSVPNADPTLPPTIEPVAGFRYLVEVDDTFKPDPNAGPSYDELSFQFHRSHHPVATDATTGAGISGHSMTETAMIEVPDEKNYFISVLPFNDHSMGGGAVEVETADVEKTVRVTRYPLPTAQISIWLFHDNNPVNGALDIDEERLSSSTINGREVPFRINLFDAAGQYGAAGGHVVWDAYGNPLGTQYNDAGDIVYMPDNSNGFVLTPNEDGELLIKNLPPAKYGVQVVPPADVGGPLWFQTSTIEGSRTIDAWVKANEPATFVEFGPPGPHVFVGFVQAFDCLTETDTSNTNCYFDPPGPAGPQPYIDTTGIVGANVSGQIVNNHMTRSPIFEFHNGELFGGCRIAVNLGITGRTIYSQACGEDSDFTIANLPPGVYSLSIWDDALNVIIANYAINVTGNSDDGYVINPVTQLTAGNDGVPGEVTGGTLPVAVICDSAINCDLGQIPVFDWFHFADTFIFYDHNEDGYRNSADGTACDGECDDPATEDVAWPADAGETIMRFRDGRIYGGLPVDFGGSAPLEEVFPFFHWLVMEVGFANHKATGGTFIVDAGGGPGGPGTDLQANGYVPQVQTQPNGDPLPPCGSDPGLQPDNCSFDGGLSRTEKGVVLLEGFQGFLGQKNVFEFGKKDYDLEAEENGGISGVAINTVTRAEDDPAYAAAEEWETGIPRTQIALFRSNRDQQIVNPDAETYPDHNDPAAVIADPQQPDVDNYPLGWAGDPLAKGPEDVDHNDNGTWDQGDAMDVTWADSWDDNLPENCAGENNVFDADDNLLIAQNRCFDGLRNWNQIRPALFDGGWAFGGAAPHLPTGYYVVQAYAPPGYEIMREEHRNVDFADEYQVEAVPTLLPPPCVGANHIVPELMAFATVPSTTETDAYGQPFVQVVNGSAEDLAAPHQGETRKLCDARHIRLAPGQNAAVDFHFVTDVPKAAGVVGAIINDLGNEFNPSSPNFGEKFGPPGLPIAFYDWQGNEINRVYSDHFGKFNALLPSSYSAAIASPSGFAPHMITSCMNDAGLIDTDGDGVVDTPDPHHNPQYSQFCYQFQYMPGGTTYLDTPVLQIAAYAGSGLQLDCAAADHTPLISEVTSNLYDGPHVRGNSSALRQLTIKSPGTKLVPNPSADELSGDRLIPRDFGFGPAVTGSGFGRVELVRENTNQPENPLNRFTMSLVSWSDTEIVANVASNNPNGRFQLVVTTADGVSSPMGVTVTVNSIAAGRVHEVFPNSAAGATPIQDAIDAAGIGDLILVTPGTYNEIPIIWKPLYLQGAGAYSTIINARTSPSEKIEAWQAKILSLLDPNGVIDLIPGQEIGPALFNTEAGAGVTVLASEFGANRFANENNRRSRIDGFTVTGAAAGGGIFANGFVKHLYISNNLVTGNQGTFGGGIRLGHPVIIAEAGGPNNTLGYSEAQNHDVRIRHNMITQNGNILGAGGGVSLYNDSDNYRINNNWICGNYVQGDGAGIGHQGDSPNGRIEDNVIVFNQSFRQTPGFETDGGGIFIGGNPGLAGVPYSDGSGGPIRIYRNLIQGNQAGAGDGGGIALRQVSGLDVAENPGTPNQWNQVQIYNNTIVNNMAGLAGGAISLKDAPRVNINSNTIANNDSTATAGLAFTSGPSISTPQVAGIVARAHETIAGLISVGGSGTNARWERGYSSPVLNDNIIWHNRSHHFVLGTSIAVGSTLVPDGYNDLGIVPPPANPNWLLTPRDSLLSDKTGYANPNWDNLDDGDIAAAGGNPVFVAEHFNGSPFIGPSGPTEFTTIAVSPALDEGGNWIDARFAPLSINDIDADLAGDQPSDYHLFPGDGTDGPSIAINAADGNRPGGLDIDREAGNFGPSLDMGSDEVQP